MSNVIYSRAWNSLRAAEALEGGGDGGDSGGMDHAVEIALLKQRTEQADARLLRIEDKLDQVIGRLGQTATKSTVWGALGTGAAIAFAVLAIFIAVLSYLQDQRISLRGDAAPPPPPPTVFIIPGAPQPLAPAAPSGP